LRRKVRAPGRKYGTAATGAAFARFFFVAMAEILSNAPIRDP
jgi:hypothetical protein